MPHEFGRFVRAIDQLNRAQAAAKKAGVPFKVLDENVETTSGHVSIGTMHLAKGLEFRAVAVMACDDEIVPLQERIETVGDDADLQEVYDTERHLLYVACTRARDHLLVSGVMVRNGRALPPSRLTPGVVTRWRRNDEPVLLLKLPDSCPLQHRLCAGSRARRAP
jgi:superfamily I DNA/RNA helicase